MHYQLSNREKRKDKKRVSPKSINRRLRLPPGIFPKHKDDPKSKALKLLRRLKANNYGLPFENVRVSDETLSLLIDNNLISIQYGIIKLNKSTMLKMAKVANYKF